jgi:YesN/AraC family two-component response regulator
MIQKNPLPFYLNRIKRGANFKMIYPHYHDTNEIFYVISGKIKFFIKDSIYNLRKGDIIYIPKGEIHKTKYNSNLVHERLCINFTDSYIKDFFLIAKNCSKIKYNYIPYTVTEKFMIANTFTKLENEYNSKDKFSEKLIEYYLNELMILFLRHQKYRIHIKTDDIDNDDLLMQKAARYISNNFRKEITLNDIANYINLSSSYFSMKFKKTTGFGFKEYLLNIRIKNASYLLNETKMNITEIAFKSGFKDSNYFGDIFKKIKGLSPSNYRKHNTN